MTEETKQALEDAGIAGYRPTIKGLCNLIRHYKYEAQQANQRARLAESNAKSPSLYELKSALNNEDAKRIAELERENASLRMQLPMQFNPPIEIHRETFALVYPRVGNDLPIHLL